METARSIFNFFMIAGVIQGFLFILITSFSKRSRDKSLVYLNGVVLFLSLTNLQIALVDNIFTDFNYFLRSLLIPFYVLIVPSFYLFLINYLKLEKKVTSFFYLTIGLFLTEIIIRGLLFPHYYSQNKDYAIAKYAQVEEIINAFFSIFIFIKAAILLFKRYDLYNFVLSFDNVKWLKKFILFGSLLLFLWSIAIILNLDEVLNPKIFIYYPLRLFSSLLLYWIGYQGFFHYYLLSERIVIRETIAKENVRQKPVSDTNRKIEKFNEIENYIAETSRFLEPDLTLTSLSEELKMSTSQLSQIINQANGTNFSDYINELRIAKAKEFLKDATFENYTIESIGLECGFNSKSTFYTAFKKFTLQTPVEFRKQN